MNVPPEVIEVLRQWVYKAENDLEAARRIMAVELNPYAVDVRYADDWREPQMGDAKRALALVAEVRTAVRSSMPAGVLE